MLQKQIILFFLVFKILHIYLFLELFLDEHAMVLR